MRDNSKGMVELLRVYERDGRPLGDVNVTIGDTVRALELPLTAAARSGFINVLNLRPFDQIPGQTHRYFFAQSTRRVDDAAEVGIRVEVGNDAKSFNVRVPMELAANHVGRATCSSRARSGAMARRSSRKSTISSAAGSQNDCHPR